MLLRACKHSPHVVSNLSIYTDKGFNLLLAFIGVYEGQLSPSLSFPDLSEAVDVYGDWIDACEQANA